MSEYFRCSKCGIKIKKQAVFVFEGENICPKCAFEIKTNRGLSIYSFGKTPSKPKHEISDDDLPFD